jgi:hypothetical protein
VQIIERLVSERCEGIILGCSEIELLIRSPDTAIRRFIDGWNDRCQPFTWTKTADDILDHATPGQRTSFTRH